MPYPDPPDLSIENKEKTAGSGYQPPERLEFQSGPPGGTAG